MLKFSLSNMILLVVIIALLIPHIWNAIPKPPVEFEGSIESNANSFQLILSQPDEREFTVTIPAHTGKRWESLEENPPVSAKEAIELAIRKRKALVPDQAGYRWIMKQSSLRPMDPEYGYWFWEVDFEQESIDARMKSGRGPNLRLAVLMDGTVVEPTVKTKRKTISRPN